MSGSNSSTPPGNKRVRHRTRPASTSSAEATEAIEAAEADLQDNSSIEEDVPVPRNRDYEVGYGKPPVDKRFRKGQSGNPGGRKAGSKNMKTIIEQLLFEPVKVRENGRVRFIPAIAACTKKQLSQALQGDPRAFDRLLRAHSLSSAVAGDNHNSRDTVAPDTETDRALLAELQRMLMGSEAGLVADVDPAATPGEEDEI